MVSMKQRYQLKDKITVDFLQSTYMDHQQGAEELALAEIYSLELAMPKFNTLACLNKTEFNKFMSNIRRTYKDSKAFTIMVAAISDTLTCMIENNKFYENYSRDNKIGLDLMISLLQTLKLFLGTYQRAIKSSQLKTVIKILEKSAERIRNEQKYYASMQQIISALKTRVKNQLDTENKMETQQMETKIEAKNNTEFDILCEDEIKENFKLPSRLIDNTLNNNTSTVDRQMDYIITKNTNSTIPLGQKQSNTPAIHASLLQPRSSNKKLCNAFELMMMSSKLLTMKKRTGAI